MRPDAEKPGDHVLYDDEGAPLARLRRDEEGVASRVRPLPGVEPCLVAAQARVDLAGMKLETPDERLADALVAGGLTLKRAATDLRHDLRNLPDPVTMPAGWVLNKAGWDDDLAAALATAYGPGHPDGGWTDNDTTTVRAMYDNADPVPPLWPASARLVGPDGRSAGHVLCAGPVPWTEFECSWVLNLAVGPTAQRRGFGWALIVHALRGSKEGGLPAVALSVADGNPARHMYDKAGFQPLSRVLTIEMPDLWSR